MVLEVEEEDTLLRRAQVQMLLLGRVVEGASGNRLERSWETDAVWMILPRCERDGSRWALFVTTAWSVLRRVDSCRREGGRDCEIFLEMVGL